ncbi:MAG: hypothetical protein OMM_11124 [Candidatus Magnetoglobus multicellularis str. Araruama]|uniref:Response regulatory domain-containing protein n=1 Tax=Candidatus Magnetoglobus multicellularis str. Araruama TaxID=890399 RepID=A0A1V1NZ71_9BACT|nr:MAG: hypothetical protein OMM_11124 [Candidatus Magnetoglobus multicellularis str. Araruama]
MIVLDMDMPDISGLDLAQMIQNHPKTYGFHLVFLNPASQSNQISHQKEKTHFISKPFREDAFYEQLIQCFSNIPYEDLINVFRKGRSTIKRYIQKLKRQGFFKELAQQKPVTGKF